MNASAIRIEGGMYPRQFDAALVQSKPWSGSNRTQNFGHLTEAQM